MPGFRSTRIILSLISSHQILRRESFWVLDSVGFFLAEETPDASSTLVVLRDIEGVTPELGTKADSDVLQNALAVYGGLSPDTREMIRAVSAPSIDKTTLITHSDIEILIGSAEDIQRKDRVARQILREQEGTVIYVNVRTENAIPIVWR